MYGTGSPVDEGLRWRGKGEGEEERRAMEREERDLWLRFCKIGLGLLFFRQTGVQERNRRALNDLAPRPTPPLSLPSFNALWRGEC